MTRGRGSENPNKIWKSYKYRSLVNGPCIFLMLLRLWIPKHWEEMLSNTAVALIVEFNGNFGIVHRAIAGCGIALMRYSML